MYAPGVPHPSLIVNGMGCMGSLVAHQGFPSQHWNPPPTESHMATSCFFCIPCYVLNKTQIYSRFTMGPKPGHSMPVRFLVSYARKQ